MSISSIYTLSLIAHSFSTIPHSCIYVNLVPYATPVRPCIRRKGRPTVVDLVPGAERSRLLPVGRLDRNTAGVLLLTNDNAWLHALTHPSHGCEKHYRCVVEGQPNE